MNDKIIINKRNIKELILFAMGIACQISQLWDKKVYILFFMIIFVLYMIYERFEIGKIKIKQGITWYGFFFLFVVFSLSYTVNNIDPGYVFERMLMCFLVQLFVTQMINFKDDFEYFMKGIAIGGAIGIIIVIFEQYSFIGIKRLGAGIYGSYAEFGNICMQALSCIIWLIYTQEKKNKNYYILAVISIIGILLSGARKAILTPLMLFILLELLDVNKKINKKVFFVLIISIFLIVGLYAVLNNELLYNSIGYRIESGLESVLGKTENDASLSERGMFKDLAKKMFLEKPFFGWGVHGFAYVNYCENELMLYSHDTFLEVLSCYGIVGFILYFSVYFRIFINYKSFLNGKKEGLFLISITCVILSMEAFSISFLSIFQVAMLSSALQYIWEVKKNEKNSKVFEQNYSDKNIS